jgi:hypothetical protein
MVKQRKWPNKEHALDAQEDARGEHAAEHQSKVPSHLGAITTTAGSRGRSVQRRRTKAVGTATKRARPNRALHPTAATSRFRQGEANLWPQRVTAKAFGSP